MKSADIVPVLRTFARLARIFGQPAEAELEAKAATPPETE